MVDEAFSRSEAEQPQLGVSEKPVPAGRARREELYVEVGPLAHDREPEGFGLVEHERVELPERGH